MNIQTVRDNLVNTINVKGEMLANINKELFKDNLELGEKIALRTTAQFLNINIGELSRILEDVEQCIEGETK